MKTLHALLAILLGAAVVAGAIGCTPAGDAEGEPIPAAIDVVALSMDNARKTGEIAPDFPFQVPVLDAEIRVAQIISPGSVWAYELATTLTPAEATEWYRRAYSNANWILDDHGEVSGDSLDRGTLYFTKGLGAESVIEIVDDGADSTTVVATVALGADIRRTY